MTTFELLVNSPSGRQEIVVVGASGGYFDASRVLWDERVDGAMPAVTLGGMRRVDGVLVFDQDLADRSAEALSVAEHNAPLLAELARIDARTIRALREGDTAIIAEREAEAVAVRTQLVRGRPWP